MIGQPAPVGTRRWLDILLLALVLVWVIGVTLAVTFAVYGLVRAIGWVIGGFAAS